MLKTLKIPAKSICKVVISFVPWVIAMYLFYWLDSSGTWTSDTPHRGKISVAILTAGMLLSFVVHSYITRRGQK